MPKYQAYIMTMYVMCALLVLAFFANLAVRPVSEKHLEGQGPPRPAQKPVLARS